MAENPYLADLEAAGVENPYLADADPGAAAYKKRKGYGKRADRWADAAIRGAADAVTFGFADEIAAGGNSLPALLPGGEDYADAFERNVAAERGIDQADREDLPVTRGAGQVTGAVAGLAAGLAYGPGQLVPRVFQRGLGRTAENALRSGAGGAVGAGVTAAGGAEGDAGARAGAAAPAAVLGGVLGAGLSPVGDVAGHYAGRVASRFLPEVERAANALRGRFDVGQARARANALTTAGAEPAAISAMDESGRGFVRAAASRDTPGREVVQRRAEGAAVNLPGRMSRQARARLSNDPRTPREIAEAQGEERATAARGAYGAVRGDSIAMAPRTVTALRTDYGRHAIREAARRENDPEVRAALNRLADDALDDPSTEITVGMADRISRVLHGMADDTRDTDLRRILTGYANDVRAPARAASTGYDEAVEGYHAQSQIMEAAERGEDFLKRDTDEFVANTPGPGQPGNDLARATARRAVERKSGENVSAAPAVARQLADAPEQQARNRALLGDEGAQRFQEGMAAEARVVRDFGDVAPRSGSQTFQRGQDAEAAGNVVEAAQAVAGGWRGVTGAVLNRLRSAGISDADAEAVSRVATDPAQLEQLLAAMERRQPGSGQRLLALINGTQGRATGEVAGPRPAVEVYLPDRPDYGVGAAYGPGPR